MLRALVVADAAGWQEEAAAALRMFTPDAIAATNNAGIEWPGRLDYWVSLHHNKCPDWPGIVVALERRLAAGRNRPQIWGYDGEAGMPGFDRCTTDWKGATGLLAVKVLREEGFERIVLAGMPMSREGGHFYDSKPWLQADRYRAAWTRHRTEIEPFVRSSSGWTKELLGAPTPEWLARD